MGRISYFVVLGCLAQVTSNAVFKFEKEIEENDTREKPPVTSRRGLEFTASLLPSKESDIANGPSCGYQTCKLGRPDMLNVHLVPHTHDDVGWLKTVDQYYYGAHNEIQHAGVQYILDTVIGVLKDDPVKRFIYVEIAFFSRWWKEQDDSLRHLVKGLVNEGRLEFILGGWCMNDEASTHYTAIIDQHTLGFRFLQQVFGDCARPKIGWQIDPFGHSREQASLFAQFGFDGLFFGRLDYQDKAERLQTKTMEHMWMASDNLGDSAGLLTGALYNVYWPPKGFCIDSLCVPQDAPIMDDPDLEGYNVDERVKSFVDAALEQAQHYTTNHIMFTMGSDFQFENAHENFKMIDKLIKYVNQQSATTKVNALYSTPSCYLYALNQANLTYTTKHDDFFPYASREHTFWTGYFSSRPALKGYARQCNSFLQVCKQLDVLSQIEETVGTRLKIDTFRKALGVSQHHDAISGTEKQNVSNDYARRLAIGVQECQDVVDMALGKLLPLATAKPPTQLFCNLLNVSVCSASESNSKFAVTVYNPVAWPVNWTATIPVTGSSYDVLDPDLRPVPAEVVPLSAETLHLPERKTSRSTGSLVFTSPLPALGFRTFFVSRNEEPVKQAARVVKEATQAADFTIKNEFTSLTFSGTTKLLKSLTDLESGVTVPLEQSLLYYRAFSGNNTEGVLQSSGAYIFRPNGSDPVAIGKDKPVTLKVYKGGAVQEVRQVYADWASQVFRLRRGQPAVEVEWTVGPIPIQDGIGKEVISLFKSDLKSQKTFYTDSNGREMLKRVRDYRPTWKLNQTEQVAGNYYPVNSRIYIQDLKRDIQITVLTDRSQGGASIKDGQMELMVHRRTLVDDAFGVGEALNETGISGKGLVVRGKHYILLDRIETAARRHRPLAQRLIQPPQLTFAPLQVLPEVYKKSFRTQWSAVNRSFPANVHLLSLEEWEGRDFLLRLEHFYEKGEDSQLSQPATVDLRDMFAPFNVTAADELTLGANQRLSEAKRLQWNVHGRGPLNGVMKDYVEPMDPRSLKVTLNPMQIRTFRITLQPLD